MRAGQSCLPGWRFLQRKAEPSPSGGVGGLLVDDAFLDMLDHALPDHGLAMGGAHVLDRTADDFGVVIGPRMPVASGDE